MASKIIGRTVCPLRCGHDAAHVKIKTDKAEGKEAFPYVYCPECGHMGHTKNERQAKALLALTRPEKTEQPAPAAPPAEPVKAPAVRVPTPTGNPPTKPAPVPPVAAPKPSGLFGLFGGANG